MVCAKSLSSRINRPWLTRVLLSFQAARTDEIMKNGDGTDELDIETRKYGC